jgi:hypothetical protein
VQTFARLAQLFESLAGPQSCALGGTADTPGSNSTFRGRTLSLKNKGVSQFFSKVAADVAIHCLAAHEDG